MQHLLPARWRRNLFAATASLAGCLLAGLGDRAASAQTANFLPPPRIQTLLAPRYAPGAPGRLQLSRFFDVYVQGDRYSPYGRFLRGAVPVLEARTVERNRLSVLYDLNSTARGEPAFGRAQLQADRDAAADAGAGLDDDAPGGDRRNVPPGLPQDFASQTGHPVVFQSDLKGNQQDFRSLAQNRWRSLDEPDPLGAFSPEDVAAAGGTLGRSKSAHTGHLAYFGNDGRHFTSQPQPPLRARGAR